MTLSFIVSLAILYYSYVLPVSNLKKNHIRVSKSPPTTRIAQR